MSTVSCFCCIRPAARPTKQTTGKAVKKKNRKYRAPVYIRRAPQTFLSGCVLNMQVGWQLSDYNWILQPWFTSHSPQLCSPVFVATLLRSWTSDVTSAPCGTIYMSPLPLTVPLLIPNATNFSWRHIVCDHFGVWALLSSVILSLPHLRKAKYAFCNPKVLSCKSWVLSQNSKLVQNCISLSWRTLWRRPISFLTATSSRQITELHAILKGLHTFLCPSCTFCGRLAHNCVQDVAAAWYHFT